MDTPRPSDPVELASAVRAARRNEVADIEVPASGEVPSAPSDVRDPRAVRIVAKTIYRELRQSGLGHEQVMAVASELLGLVTDEVRSRRTADPKP